ncbi:MAG: ATP-binding protein [Stigonema ocellatum SAG 48.90 = DSM 106950]|nr:ATP-binding protein [Stigonema ocellatum SAG 48.90 = DSM 106950]
MNQIFGEFIEEFPLDHDSLELSFTSSSRPIKKGWRNIRLSAYFIADYFSTFFPIHEDAPQGEDRIKASQNTLSYIGNELLENAMKFNEEIKHYKVKFGIHFLEDREKVTAVIFTKNSINPQKAEKFQAFIQELLSADPQELYVQQIENTALDEDNEASGLGLLTMLNDYSAKLGWKFESDPSHPRLITVTTMAQVVV